MSGIPGIPKPPPAAGSVQHYLTVTRGAWYGYVFALPVLAGYEFLQYVFHGEWQVVNAADAILSTVFRLLGSQGRAHALLAVILLSGVYCWRADAQRRGEGSRLEPRYFGAMLLESILYAFFLAPVVNYIQRLLAMDTALLQNPAGGGGFLYSLSMSLGAGIYEELLFRVLLMGGLAALLIRFGKLDTLVAWVIAAAVSSVAFSGFHYLGPLGEPFEFGSFLYRMIAGGVFAVIYGARGFGVVVWTHALYDILVLLVWQR